MKTGIVAPLPPHYLLVGLFVAVASLELFGQDAKESTIDVKAEIKAENVASTGRFEVHLTMTPATDITAAFRIEAALFVGEERLFATTVAPQPPTKSWKKEKPVTIVLPCVFPFDTRVGPGDPLAFCVAFVDAATREKLLPNAPLGVVQGMGYVAAMNAPTETPPLDDKRIDELIELAVAAKNSGRPQDGWNILETSFRRIDHYPFKLRLRDGLLKVGLYPSEPVSSLEEAVVLGRIEDEKRRYLRLMAGRWNDQGKFHAALRILELIGGKLAEEADAAVIGALADAERVEADRQDIKRRLFERISNEEKALAEADSKKLGRTQKTIEHAADLAKKKQYAVALAILRDVALSQEAELRKAAGELKTEIEKAWLADTPPAEKALVQSAVDHPAWARTKYVVTKKFILIGPDDLINGIPAESRLRFDLAYLFLTDLFGRVPNPSGDRCTVYFKELWDFGGGVGGGTTIDIGNADPKAKETRIDNGLLYHELTHCVDDTQPIFPGHREGLANFGAAFVFDVLGQKGDSLHSFQSNLDAFKKEYLGRDLEYWRIQNYGPSAGFFLSFIEKYGKTSWGRDWRQYRAFFRAYRERPVRDGRWPTVGRAMAAEFVRAFGPGAFDDLIAFRFPLVPSDRDALKTEDEVLYDDRSPPNEGDVDRLDGSPNSPIRRDHRGAMLDDLVRAQDPDAADFGVRELGIVRKWRVIGPFQEASTDPLAVAFPPEATIDFAAEYPGKLNRARWSRPADGSSVTIDERGWVNFSYEYQGDSALYAVTHVTVEKDTEAFAHMRFDDEAALFVENRRIDSFENAGANSDSWLHWRGPCAMMPDAVRAPIRLHAGRNRILVKIKNDAGKAGFVFALTDRDQRAIAGLTADDEAAAPSTTGYDIPRDAWSKKKINFDDKGAVSAVDVVVGKWNVQRKSLYGTSRDRGVAWRKYTVRPGFPKDSPSNLFWLKPADTRGMTDFEISLDLVGLAGAPKIGVVFQGEGETDGLSGWTLILHPQGNGVQARLERYDRLVHQSAVIPVTPTAGALKLEISCVDEFVDVRIGDASVFKRASIRGIPGKDRIGVMTWGPDFGIATIELRQPKPKR